MTRRTFSIATNRRHRLRMSTMALSTKQISLLVFAILVCCINSDEVGDFTEYDYKEGSSKGPDHWGELKPEWRVCGEGKKQSPIDLEKSAAVAYKLGRLERKYKPAAAVLKNRGHDIQVAWNGDAGSVVINGTNYYVTQLHWHTPSEHTIDGTRFDLELHIVHVSSRGGVAVVGVIYKFGLPDLFLAKLRRAIRLVGSTAEVDLGFINPREANIGSRRHYYRYDGSLTTPPCTEGVIWTVMEKVKTASRNQIRALQHAVDDGYIQMNARPTQPLNGREIWKNDPSHAQLN